MRIRSPHWLNPGTRDLKGLDLEFEAQPASLAAVRRAVLRAAEAAGLPDEKVQAIHIAVGEAATNVVEHAYSNGGKIYLRAYRDGPHFLVEIQDHGQWRGGPARVMAGRGIPMMRALVDDVDIVREPSGTTVRLTVSADSDAAAP